MTTHNCYRCGVAKPLNRDHFHRSPKTKSGFDGTCKACRNARNAELKGRSLRYTKKADERKAGRQTCNACHETLPLNEDHYPRNRQNPSGFDYTCRVCRTIKQAERRAEQKQSQRTNSRSRSLSSTDRHTQEITLDSLELKQPELVSAILLHKGINVRWRIQLQTEENETEK